MSADDSGKRIRVLVVEDDAFQAFDLAERLSSAGFAVVGPAASVAEAMPLLTEGGCDTAVLDVHLGPNETSEQLAHELRARSIPFVTVTGYSHEQRPAAFDKAPVLTKPVRLSDLVAVLRGFSGA